jgi:hypothetical protein
LSMGSNSRSPSSVSESEDGNILVAFSISA